MTAPIVLLKADVLEDAHRRLDEPHRARCGWVTRGGDVPPRLPPRHPASRARGRRRRPPPVPSRWPSSTHPALRGLELTPDPRSCLPARRLQALDRRAGRCGEAPHWSVRSARLLQPPRTGSRVATWLRRPGCDPSISAASLTRRRSRVRKSESNCNVWSTDSTGYMGGGPSLGTLALSPILKNRAARRRGYSDDDACPLSSERVGLGSTDAAPATGHDRDLRLSLLSIDSPLVRIADYWCYELV